MRASSVALGILIGAVFFTGASVVLAWTGPASTPPNGNVSAPLNVGNSDQIKNAGLGLNSLAVFGNMILSGASLYLNFGATAGSSGYGFRDNGGTMEVKDSGGAWSRFATTSSSGTFQQIRFTDGTSQTTAASGGGITAITTASCGTAPSTGCTVICPSQYYRTGCSGNPASNMYITPASNGCTCTYGGLNSVCYAYCAK